LSKETELLSREIDELEYDFDFNMELYAYQGVIMLKLDKNLLETYTKLVPDLVGDETFWRNYFYEIEKYFGEIG
jgi:hypothetical protein